MLKKLFPFLAGASFLAFGSFFIYLGFFHSNSLPEGLLKISFGVIMVFAAIFVAAFMNATISYNSSVPEVEEVEMANFTSDEEEQLRKSNTKPKAIGTPTKMSEAKKPSRIVQKISGIANETIAKNRRTKMATIQIVTHAALLVSERPFTSEEKIGTVEAEEDWVEHPESFIAFINDGMISNLPSDTIIGIDKAIIEPVENKMYLGLTGLPDQPFVAGRVVIRQGEFFILQNGGRYTFAKLWILGSIQWSLPGTHRKVAKS